MPTPCRGSDRAPKKSSPDGPTNKFPLFSGVSLWTERGASDKLWLPWAPLAFRSTAPQRYSTVGLGAPAPRVTAQTGERSGRVAHRDYCTRVAIYCNSFLCEPRLKSSFAFARTRHSHRALLFDETQRRRWRTPFKRSSPRRPPTQSIVSTYPSEGPAR